MIESLCYIKNSKCLVDGQGLLLESEFNIINKIYPESLHDKFVEGFTISKCGTRNKTDLQNDKNSYIKRLSLAISAEICFAFSPVET